MTRSATVNRLEISVSDRNRGSIFSANPGSACATNQQPPAPLSTIHDKLTPFRQYARDILVSLAPFRVVVILVCAVSVACAQRGGYSRSELVRNCLRTVQFEPGWVRVSGAPPDAVAIRRAASANLRSLDLENPPENEVWFGRGDSSYLLCYLGGSTGCGQTSTVVSRVAGA